MTSVKPKLLVTELWGLGDLVIATPFLQAASERFSVTLVAKPYALDLQRRFWPAVQVIPFVAPWTAFTGKYRLHKWPWRQFFGLRRRLINERFDVGLSARWGDPRDHLLLVLARAKRRIGFPRMGSQLFLTEPLQPPDPLSHRYEYWCALAGALEITMPRREQLPVLREPANGEVLIHSGAGQPVRVWPLERYHALARRLRERSLRVQVACDPDQREWWLRFGETKIATPESVAELFSLIDRAGVFIGNDSGPGHLAAFCGVPTLTLFGPQVPEWFAPLPSAAEWIEGTACPYKPCSDYCRFSTPRCLLGLDEPEVWKRVENFVARHERSLTGARQPVT